VKKLLQKLDLKLVKKLQLIDEEVFAEVRFEVGEESAGERQIGEFGIYAEVGFEVVEEVDEKEVGMHS
jgi:hypothetical protein